MSCVALLKYLPYILKIVKMIIDKMKDMESEKERLDFLKEIGDAFEKAKSGDTSDIERLFNGK